MEFQSRGAGGEPWKGICRLGALAALILLIYSVLTIILYGFLGGAPDTAQECFELIQSKRVVALLRLDLPTVVVMPVFCLLYAGLYGALQRGARALGGVGAACAFLGVPLILANASVLSLVYLSNQYAAATTEARRTLLLAAGEAAISADMWHGTAAKMGGILLQLAGVLISVAMLRSRVFSKLTGYLGLVTHGLDLAHILIGFFWPGAAIVALAIGGSLYLIWFPLVGRRLYALGKARLDGEKGIVLRD